jgi:hypothetical protein
MNKYAVVLERFFKLSRSRKTKNSIIDFNTFYLRCLVYITNTAALKQLHKAKSTAIAALILAGAEGLEPSRTVLETAMLPLHHAPKTLR